ncbi:unnamed protein product [Caenorhabditis brenneri]
MRKDIFRRNENFTKVSSQQNQPLYGEASKIPAGSGPARDSAEDMPSSKEGDKDASRKQKIVKRPEFNNGGSLEDCVSNVYALLDLPGIKWKCFRPKPNAPRGLPLASDLILKAYSKCVLNEILATWRRKPLPPTDNTDMLPAPYFSNDSAKELWVFWFDEEPEELAKHCEGLESDEELSSANQMNIVSYEVRTILFKALHIVLERDLIKDGFVRFGRWFTVPLPARENYLHYLHSNHSPAIRFNFFVHGSHTVCASVQAQRQPTLIALAKRHIECKAVKRFPVVVGPWSMRGILVQDQLTILADPSMQENVEKEYNQWKEYIQIEEKEPEIIVEERPKTPDPEPSVLHPTRVLLASSSDEEPTTSYETDQANPESVPQRPRWMYEPDAPSEKPRELTYEEKEKRNQAREVRRRRRKNREERRKEQERQRSEVKNPEEYDSDVVTDPEVENKEEESVDSEIPKMVLVEIDNVRMLYPSKLICVTLDDDRQMLESMGLKTNPVPSELHVPGRRPRVKNVVNLSNPVLSTRAVVQYCENEIRQQREEMKRRCKKPITMRKRRAAVNDTFLTWKTKYQKSYHTPIREHNMLEAADDVYVMGDKLDRYGDLCQEHERVRYQEIALEGRTTLIERKDDFHAYHKKRMMKTLKERQKRRPLKKKVKSKGSKRRQQGNVAKLARIIKPSNKIIEKKAKPAKKIKIPGTVKPSENVKPSKSVKLSRRLKSIEKALILRNKRPLTWIERWKLSKKIRGIRIKRRSIYASKNKKIKLKGKKSFCGYFWVVLRRRKRKRYYGFPGYMIEIINRRIKRKRLRMKSAEQRRERNRKIGSLNADYKKIFEESDEALTSTVRPDNDDEPKSVDKFSIHDWSKCEAEMFTPGKIPDCEIEEIKPVYDMILPNPHHEEAVKPTPFYPIHFLSNNEANNEFEMMSGDEEMSEERFNEVFKDKLNRWKPNFTRGEKIENADYQFDPSNRPVGSPKEYHLKEIPKKSKFEPVLAIPPGNKYFKGSIIKNGLRGFEELCAEKDAQDAMKKAKYLKKTRRKVTKREIKTARACHLELKRQIVKRSLKKTLNKLRLIISKDTVVEESKKFKQSTTIRINNVRMNKFLYEKELARQVLLLCDPSSIFRHVENGGPYGLCDVSGLISPDYSNTPHSFDDEHSDSEIDERYGLGEGTSDKYQDGDSVDMIEPETQVIDELPMEMSSMTDHIRTVGDHLGPDGMLSPPASNEMPKGGPLSVGPPSIESQGLNQIYPTPPSVQMLQGDASQALSPGMHIKMRYTVNTGEDDIERISIPGGGATIVEIKADDDETRNMKKWNNITKKSKLSHFLSSSCHNPIFNARKKKSHTPCTENFQIVNEIETVPSELVYKSMVTRKFDCAPHRAFAVLIQPKASDRRIPPPFTLPQPSTSAHPSLSTPMAPVFQSPALPPQHIPSPFSVGPMGHPSMGPPAYPGTPGAFPPTTPTYPQMTPRPGSNFGPGPGYSYPHQMGAPGYPGQMGQMGQMGVQRQFSNPQMFQHHQHQMQQMQMRMQQMRQMGQGVPPGYGAPGMPPYQPGTPGSGGYVTPVGGPSSVQRLNNFVNQSQFGPTSGPYGSMQPMIPQSPNFNQQYSGMGNPIGSPMVNPMMSPMQQHQFHQQQMMQQQQHHQQQQQQQQIQLQQMQRNQMQLQNSLPPQIAQPPNPQLLLMQQNEQVYNAFHGLSERDKRKFSRRQMQLKSGLMPTSLQPAAIKNLPNPPDANVPYKKQDSSIRPPDLNVPRGDSLTVAIVLSDTLLDLHFDSVFDACPICSCSVSIRSRDLGMYINPHMVLSSRERGHTNMREYTIGNWSGFHVNAPTTCTCGFSAIRHRYLSWCSGLFEEDADEATTSEHAVAPVIPPLDYPKKSTARDMVWFDSKSVHDLALIDQIRKMSYSNSLGKAVAQMGTIKEHNRNIAISVEISSDITVPSEYILSHVDTLELLMLGNSALGPMQKSGVGNQTPFSQFPQKFLNYFHPWGFQTANEITELNSSEWDDLLGLITPTLEVSMKQARHVSPEVEFKIEGPMTWKEIVMKANRGTPLKEDDDDPALAEPIPAIMRSMPNEAIRAAPNIEQYADQALLGPIDQPKDVMYITIIPDDDLIFEQAVNFMDTVTETYETMRLGRHIPFPVSTGTATRFREVMTSFQSQFPFPEQHQQLVKAANAQLHNVSQNLAAEIDPLNKKPEYWSKKTKRKIAGQEELKQIETEDPEVNWKDKRQFKRGCRHPKLRFPEKHSAGFYDREGILRVGTPMAPVKSHQSIINTVEFENMTKHLTDSNGFVTRLRLYLQQLEDIVFNVLIDTKEAFERSGYRYQMAVEGRLKRQKHRKDIEEERIRYSHAKREDEQGNPQPPDEIEIGVGTEIGEATPEPWVDDELEEKRRQRERENEQYPPEGNQAPSPVPAGMIHIPETLSEQEKLVQPTLADIFSDPTVVAPHNAQNIAWKQRDTRVPNPFPYSNQPPVAFEATGSSDTDEYSTLPHVIVLYIVNPFTYGAEKQTALHMRIAILSFIRAFNSIVGRLPYNYRPQLQLEIIGMESMDPKAVPFPDYLNDPKIPFDILHDNRRKDAPTEYGNHQVARSLSVAVYTHPRVFFPDVYKSVSARCMTAFGPGTQLINTVNSFEKLNQESYHRMLKRSKGSDSTEGYGQQGMMPPHQLTKNGYISYQIPSNISCLAPAPPVYQMDENGKPSIAQMDEQTLFVSYCLIGKEYLVATATDSQGKLIDNCLANIKPRRKSNEVYRYTTKTQILDGMGKLWSFILGVMSSDIKNWRLVVGRLGRIGHGEFRAWTHLLNKTSLLRYSSSLKDICGACRSMPTAVGTPAILSACLITLEPEPSIRIMPEIYDDEETCTKKNSVFHTPGDLSCTHILTFPVGTEINLEVQDQTSDIKAEENWEFGDLDIMEGLDDGDTEIMKDLGLETPSSAAIRHGGQTSMFFSEDSSSIEIQNQPLASGYYISTAPAPELPTWFWATCPSAKRHSPVHLKSSLHINISEVKNDDIAMESSKEKEKEKEKEEKDAHPLESRQTEEVLRHVLESYNALSWLNLNRDTGDRYSCLPIHIQHLLRLYHNVARLLG